MAQFRTHLAVTSIISGIASTMLLASTITTPQEASLYFALCVTGGLLPDIDSGNSVPARLLFTFMATAISFIVIFRQHNDNTVMELFLIWTGSFVLIKYLLFSLFAKITVHRGIIHSIPAAIFFGFICTIVLYRIFHFNEFVSWMSGLSVFGGCLIHLLIDELCSLNINGKRPKKSAGTALKFWSVSDLKSTAFMYFAIIILFIGTPEHKKFYTIIRQWFSGMGSAINQLQGSSKLMNSQKDSFVRHQKR